MKTTALFALLGYASGSVLYALVFARLFHKDILTDTRDQNPGVANAFQKGGFLCGLLTLCCELLKGFLPVALYLRQGGSEAGLLLVLAAPVLGHVFPAWRRFHGGKGIAVSFGCLLGLAPDLLPVLIFAGTFILFSTVIKISPHFYRTLAAFLCACIAMPLLGVGEPVCLGFFLMTITVFLRFRLSQEEKEQMEVKWL